jgi:hypothetical protein
VVELVAAKLAFELAVGPLAFGNIADVDIEACPDKFVEEAGTAAVKRADELIVTQPRDEVGSNAGMLGGG